MATITTSGRINGTTSNENIDARLDWKMVSDTETNQSVLTIELEYCRRNDGFTTSGTGSFTIGIGNWGPSTTKYFSISTNGQWKTAETREVTYSHDSSGYLAPITVWGSGYIPDTTLTSTNVRGTITFPVIPRATNIDSLSCATSYFAGALTYKYTPKSASFYNRCNISVNLGEEFVAVKSINLGQKEASQQTATVTLSAAELSTVYNALPKTSKGTLRFTFRTYSDSGYSTQVGDAQYKDISLSIPNNTDTQPTVTMALSPVSDFTSDSAIYVRTLSKVKATFTNGAGKYGASISSYKMTVSGKDYASPYTSDYLEAAGSITVKGTVTDSRGFSRSYSQTITVIDYVKPTIDLLTCSTTYFNGTITHKYTPPNNTFYTRCAITLGSTTVKSETHTRASGQQTVSFSFEEEDLKKIYEALPNSTSGTLKFTLQAFTDSNYSKKIGSDSIREITLSIPDIDATKPTATMSTSPVTSLKSPFDTLYIKGKSKVTANLSSGQGKYGASITSYKVSIGSQSGTPPQTSPYFTTSGDVTITGTVTDSRGFSRTYTQTITVLDYGPPKVVAVSGENSVIAARCNAAGVLDNNGTYLKIKAKRSFSKVVASGVQKNFCKIQYRYKVEGGAYSAWTVVLERTSTSDEIITGALLGGVLDTMHTYIVQVQVIDDIGEKTTTSISVPTERVYMHRAGSLNSLGIGKYAEDENTVDIAEEMTTIFRGEVQFKSEEWLPRDLGTNVSESTVNSGRWGGSGVFYRVCAGGKHIYVAFNVKFTTSSSTVRAESQTIPYPPTYDVYALCPVGFADGSRGIATVSVSPKGRVNIYAVHKLPGATLSSGETVNWIDGYIDYWT